MCRWALGRFLATANPAEARQLIDDALKAAVDSGSRTTLLYALRQKMRLAMQSLPHFYASSLLFGCALTGLGDIPVGALAARWFAKGRGLVLGFIYVGSNIGGSQISSHRPGSMR